MTKALVLRAITGAHAGKRHTLNGRVSSLGSAANNDVVLHDRLVNPRHIEIRQVLERWFVVPMGQSSQGLALNGMPVNGQSRLNLGDSLTLGGTTYTVELEEIQEQALGDQPSGGVSVPRLGEYFIRRGILSREQVLVVAERQSRLQRDGARLQFGQVAYEMGVISRSQLDMALADQRSDFNDRFY